MVLYIGKIDFQVRTLKFHICKTEVGVVYVLSSPYANFEASFKPFLISMKAGESDTTRPSLVVTPIFVQTIFLHEIKNC